MEAHREEYNRHFQHARRRSGDPPSCSDSREKLIFNLGNGRGFSVREVIEVASKITNRQIQCEDAPRRAGDPAVLIASSEKIEREIWMEAWYLSSKT